MPLDLSIPPTLSIGVEDLQISINGDGVIVTHQESGSVGNCRDERLVSENKRSAFQKMAETETFRTWTRQAVRRIVGNGRLIVKNDGWIYSWIRPEKMRIDVWWRELR